MKRLVIGGAIAFTIGLFHGTEAQQTAAPPAAPPAARGGGPPGGGPENGMNTRPPNGQNQKPAFPGQTRAPEQKLGV